MGGISHVYVFGSGDCGQLGLGEDVDMAKKPVQHPYFEGRNIIRVVAGGLHSLALSSEGKVRSRLIWGNNNGDRFTRGDAMMRKH